MNVVALAGGVGGAKLADGLARCLAAHELTIIVNTGDDFEHLGLTICPDLDTVCYTLGGLANPETGWGQANETWKALQTIIDLGGPGWFRLGDSDLGLHLERTRRLRQGESLSQITRRVCQAWGIGPTILPMSDDAVPTTVYTRDEGELPFQEYFVQRGCQPQVTGFRYQNAASARPTPGLLEAIDGADLVVFCPSNPWVSIGPILAVPGIQSALVDQRVLAVSPIIGGQAVKGPAAKMFVELGIQPSALAVANQYGNLLTGFILDEQDRSLAEAVADLGIIPLVTDTLMKTPADRWRLASEVLAFGEKLEKSSRHAEGY